MGIGKILGEILTDKKMKPSELARKVGVTPSTIDSIIKRDSTKVNITTLNDICKVLSISPEIFFEDFVEEENKKDKPSISDLEMIRQYHALDAHGKLVVDSVLGLEYERCTQENNVIDMTIELPMSELPASAGTGIWLEEGYNTPVTVRKTKEAQKANIVIRVSGDSMEPLYSDGDCVLVKIQPDIEPGEIGIFIVDNEGFIKKRGKHELISVNPEYDNIEIGEFSDCRCFGKVLGKAETLE